MAKRRGSTVNNGSVYYQRHREYSREQVLARTKEYHRIKRLQAKMLKEMGGNIDISNSSPSGDNNIVGVDSKSTEVSAAT